MEDKLQLRLGELVQKQAAKKTEEWNPPQRKSLDRVPVGPAEEERILQLIMGTCKDPRPAAFAAMTPTSPLLLHELMEMRNSGGCKVTGFRQAAPAAAYPMNGNGASSLFAIQSNDDASCCSSTRTLELDSQNAPPLPYGWEKCLDLQTGSIYYLNRNTGLTTSVDPRMAPPSSSTASGCHVLTTIWPPPPPPTSPSSASSDVTFECVPTRPCTVDGSGRQGQLASSAVKAQGEVLGLIPSPINRPDDYEWSDLDLTLSLRPCSGLMKKQPPEACKATSINIAATASSSQALNSHGSPNINNLSSVDLSHSSACHSTVFSEANKFCRMPLSDVSKSMVIPSTPAFARAGKSQLQRADSEVSCMVLFKSIQLDGQRYQNEVSATTNMSVISNRGDDDSEEVATPTSCMITGGCPRCLMFVMVPGTSMPKCPRCGSHIDINTPGLAAAARTRSVSSERDMLSPPPKKAKLLPPAAISMESLRSSRKPAASLV